VPIPSRRIERERATVAAMIRIYCRLAHPGRHGECPECRELGEYASRRLERCPYQDEKPPCADCPIHCYQPARREQIREVMRRAGPRMFFRHPIFAIRHWLDGFREAPPARRRQDGVPAPDGAREGRPPAAPGDPRGGGAGGR
jgi:hypothetical protein